MTIKIKCFWLSEGDRRQNQSSYPENIRTMSKQRVLEYFKQLGERSKTPLKELVEVDTNELEERLDNDFDEICNFFNVTNGTPVPESLSLVKGFKKIYKEASKFDWKTAKKTSPMFEIWCAYIRSEKDWGDIMQRIFDEQYDPLHTQKLSEAMYKALVRYKVSFDDILILVRLLKKESDTIRFSCYNDYIESSNITTWNEQIFTVIGDILRHHGSSNYRHEPVLIMLPALTLIAHQRLLRDSQNRKYFKDWYDHLSVGSYYTHRISSIINDIISVDGGLYLKCFNMPMFDGIDIFESLTPDRNGNFFHGMVNEEGLKKRIIERIELDKNYCLRMGKVYSGVKDEDMTQYIEDVIRKMYSFSFMSRFTSGNRKGLPVQRTPYMRKRLFEEAVNKRVDEALKIRTILF